MQIYPTDHAGQPLGIKVANHLPNGVAEGNWSTSPDEHASPLLAILDGPQGTIDDVADHVLQSSVTWLQPKVHGKDVVLELVIEGNCARVEH